MFKLLTIGLISFLGMNYANNTRSNISYNASVRDDSVVRGGSSYDTLDSGFYKIDGDFRYGLLDVDYAPGHVYSYDYSIMFKLKADYVLFADGSNIYEQNDYNDMVVINCGVSNGLFQLQFSHLFNLELYENDDEIDGLGQYLESLEGNNYALYLDNPSIERILFLSFFLDGSRFDINDSNNTSNKFIPFVSDNRFTWINKDFTFGDSPLGLGYFLYDDNSYYKLGYAVQSSTTQLDNIYIFKGLFKSFDEYFDSYRIQYMQVINGSNYFGALSTTELSNAIHLTQSDYFYPFAGQYHKLGFATATNNVSAWYTQYVQLGTSGTVNTVITNNRYFVNTAFRTLHLYYQLNDFTNQTSVYGKSYYDLLTYNPSYAVYPSGDSGNAFNNVFDLLGYAFRKLWDIGNIALLGTITLNTLIILPLVISLVLFVIHLIKKG